MDGNKPKGDELMETSFYLNADLSGVPHVRGGIQENPEQEKTGEFSVLVRRIRGNVREKFSGMLFDKYSSNAIRIARYCENLRFGYLGKTAVQAKDYIEPIPGGFVPNDELAHLAKMYNDEVAFLVREALNSSESGQEIVGEDKELLLVALKINSAIGRIYEKIIKEQGSEGFLKKDDKKRLKNFSEIWEEVDEEDKKQLVALIEGELGKFSDGPAKKYLEAILAVFKSNSEDFREAVEIMDATWATNCKSSGRVIINFLMERINPNTNRIDFTVGIREPGCTEEKIANEQRQEFIIFLQKLKTKLNEDGNSLEVDLESIREIPIMAVEDVVQSGTYLEGGSHFAQVLPNGQKYKGKRVCLLYPGRQEYGLLADVTLEDRIRFITEYELAHEVGPFEGTWRESLEFTKARLCSLVSSTDIQAFRKKMILIISDIKVENAHKDNIQYVVFSKLMKKKISEHGLDVNGIQEAGDDDLRELLQSLEDTLVGILRNLNEYQQITDLNQRKELLNNFIRETLGVTI